MKITLNTSIPEDKRPEVESVVKKFVGKCEVLWASSRFPRLVIFIEPGPDNSPEPENGSIFESPRSGTKSLSAVTGFLEDHIKTAMKK
ncbi:MAG: hypothetical protein JWO82_1253 [Akkermansiaceae bacterium]|nr:hypothetical protein [Akkermansiaceae bacterium]